MLRVIRKSDRTVPILCCDCCNAWIDDAELGAAIYKRTQAEGEVQDVLLAHKGTCHDAIEARLGGDTHWQELTKYLEDVTHNAGYDLASQVRRRQLEDDYGTL
ncbi:hypothetical protein DBR42_22450 [Pelomonas sp. HMWF004]|nr:hypothetical protein DBR42_22450 [Pelomonas sp. HMWF004]